MTTRNPSTYSISTMYVYFDQKLLDLWWWLVGTGFGPVAFVAVGLKLGHEAGGLRPPLASPAPMLRSRASPGSNARHWSPDVILGFTEYAHSFPNIFTCLSLSLCSLDNHFCTIVNSISLFLLDRSQQVMSPALSVLWNQHLLVLSFLKRC
jgi:hypothetical protein